MGTTVQWLLAGLFMVTAASATSAQGRSPRAPQSPAEQRADRTAARTAARIAREPNPRMAGAARRDGRAVREEHRRTTDDRTAQRHDRVLPYDVRGAHEFGRDVALRQQLAHVDRLRDQALLTGDDELLDRADAMEIEVRNRFARIEASARGGHEEFGRFTTSSIEPSLDGQLQSLPPVPDFERGLGRETARQARGLEPLAAGEVDLGAPGYGRRTAAERRYLRGAEPRGPWDAQYWPMPQDPPPADGAPLPATEPVVETLPEVTQPATDTLAP